MIAKVSMAGSEGFAMPTIALRQDYDAVSPRALARCSKDARQVRRLLPLAAVYDGAMRTNCLFTGPSNILDRVNRWDADAELG